MGLNGKKIELSTMNGARSFRYAEEEDEEGADTALGEAGLGKMTALRVTEIVEEEEEDGGEESGNENETDKDSDEED